MNGIDCIKGEIHNVITQLRLSTRKKRSYDSIEDHFLVSHFLQLNDTLDIYQDLNSVDSRAYLYPFLCCIISLDVDTNMTLISMQSIHKFLLYGLININSPNASDAVGNIVYSMLKAKFSKASIEDIDFIYVKTMEIFLDLLRSPVGILLTNDSVCSMVEECYHIFSSRGEKSKLINRYAENIMTQMCLVLFSRLNLFQPGTNDRSLLNPPKLISTSELSELDDQELYILPDCSINRGPQYNVIALYRVFLFLIGLIQPNDENNVNVRELGLKLINVCLETSGPFLSSHILLVDVIQNDLCKHVLHNSHTTSLSVLSLTLRIVFDLFISLKKHLKVQLEVFFTSIYLRIGDNKESLFEQRELVLESLLEFCREPSLIVGLHRNYDCEVGSTNLFEDLLKFLSQCAIPHSYTISLTPIHFLAVHSLSSVIDSISARFCRINSDDSKSELAGDHKALQQYQQKKKLELAALHFNEEGRQCFKFLQGIKVLPDPLTAESIALFLKNTPGLDKTSIGSYLGSEKKLNKNVLDCFTKLFDFSGMTLDKSLRAYLDAFRLPKEAQQISRVLESFSRYFYECSPGCLKHYDAAFVLCYSVILLNTDAHNPLVLKKMTCSEFIKNNRGINAGESLPDEYLASLFDSIVNNEIQLKSGDDKISNIDGTPSAVTNWDKIVKNAQVGGTEFHTSASHTHGKEMILVTWNTIIPIFMIYLKKIDIYNEKITKSIHSFARVCSVFELNDILNNLIISICKILCDQLENIFQIYKYENNPKTFQFVFGNDNSIQTTLTLLFHLVNSYGEKHVFEAWSNVLHCLLWLNRLHLLPAAFINLDDFRAPNGSLLESLKKEYAATKKSTKSIFAVFSMLSYDSENIIKDDNVAADRAFDVISSCQIESLFASTKYFNMKSLSHIVQNLVVICTYSSKLITLSTSPLLIESLSNELQTDESAVFCLERLWEILDRNALLESSRILSIWNPIYQFFDIILSAFVKFEIPVLLPNLMSNYFNLSTVSDSFELLLKSRNFVFDDSGIIITFFLERIVVNLFRISFRFMSKGENVDDLITLFTHVYQWPNYLLFSMGSRIIAGIFELVKTCSNSIQDPKIWQLIFEIIVRYSQNHNFRYHSWEVIKFVAENPILTNFKLSLLYICSYLCPITNNDDSNVFNNTYGDVKPHNIIDCVVVSISKLKLLSINSNNGVDSDLFQNWFFGLSILVHLTLNLDKYQSVVGFKDKSYSFLCLDGLHKLLLGKTESLVIDSPQGLKKCFESILLPLVQNLTSEFASSENFIKIRLKVCHIIFQVFLHNALCLSKLPDFHIFWLKLVGTMERNMKNSDSDILYSHFSENLKNIMMVMYSSKIFEDIKSRSNQDLSSLTWNVIGSFNPILRRELEDSLNSFLINYNSPKQSI